MGPAGLTAVFGMGTGVSPPVWSPEMCPAGGQARPGTVSEVGHTKSHNRMRMVNGRLHHNLVSKEPYGKSTPSRWVWPLARLNGQGGQRPDRGGQAAWLLGPVG
jgi:hypothetical protein